MGTETIPGAPAPHDCHRGAQLLRQLRDDDMDAAIESGLMQYVPCPACDLAVAAQLAEAQQHLTKVWAARERYRVRNERLSRRAAEREAKRASAVPAEMKSSLHPPPPRSWRGPSAKAGSAGRDDREASQENRRSRKTRSW